MWAAGRVIVAVVVAAIVGVGVVVSVVVDEQDFPHVATSTDENSSEARVPQVLAAAAGIVAQQE